MAAKSRQKVSIEISGADNPFKYIDEGYASGCAKSGFVGAFVDLDLMSFPASGCLKSKLRWIV